MYNTDITKRVSLLTLKAGDILFYCKFNETFTYDPSRDKVVVSNYTGRFKYAIENEIKMYSNKDEVK